MDAPGCVCIYLWVDVSVCERVYACMCARVINLIMGQMSLYPCSGDEVLGLRGRAIGTIVFPRENRDLHRLRGRVP